MSLLPYFLDDAPFFRPSRLLDQRFGAVLDTEDLLQPMVLQRYNTRYPNYLRNWLSAAQQDDAGSVVVNDKDKFQANLDVQQFRPEEITVKVTGDNTVTIEGKHEERPDEHGHIYRHFVRKYTLPKNVDMGRVESKLSSDGVLSITAPKTGEHHKQHKSIPITQTGEPARIEKKPSEAVEEKSKLI